MWRREHHERPAAPGEANLAPLGTGARWTYRITDPLRDAPFEKVVEVVGPQQVPGSTQQAILVVDSEPTQEERGWILEQGGFVLRAREEDRKAGVLVRTTTWTPAAPKTLSAEAPAGYTYEVTVREHEEHPVDGTVSDKDQTYRFTVVATNVQVTVPAGTFTCLQVARVRLDKPGSESHLLARARCREGSRGGRANGGARRVHPRSLSGPRWIGARTPLSPRRARSRGRRPPATPAALRER